MSDKQCTAVHFVSMLTEHVALATVRTREEASGGGDGENREEHVSYSSQF